MTVLTESEEKTIINWIIESAKKGFPKRREDVIASVKIFLDDCPRDHPFGKHNMPGKGWYNLFLKRHPCITTRIPEAVTAASSKISPENLFKWFNQIENYLTDKNLLSILSDPSRLFNGDETNFLLCPKTKNVLAKVGTKNVYEVEQAPSKSCLTVMFSFSAAGNMVPPMIIYPYKRIPDGIRNSVPPHWGVGRSDSGWMTKEVFFEYISNIFYPYLTKNNIQFPVILFVDGHVTHLTYELSVLCKKLEIILIALYPNATRILQPCDVSAFKPLKSAWQKVVLNWKRDNMHSTLKRENFAPLLQKAIDQAVNPVTIQNGFKACGIYPFNKLAIDFSKCLGKSIHGNKHDTVQGQSNELDENRNTINLQQFSDIVGTKLVELQSVEDRDLILKAEEFQCLHKIYKSLLITSDIIKPMDIMDINDFIYLPDEFSVEPIEAIEERELECRDTPETQVEEESVNCVAVSQLIEPINVEPNKATVKTIDQYMRWVTTPERKNNKSYKENLPFVITSSGYSKIQEQKRKEKVEKEVQKEQRQLLRIENREKKLKLKQEKSIIKKSHKKNPILNCRLTNIL